MSNQRLVCFHCGILLAEPKCVILPNCSCDLTRPLWFLNEDFLPQWARDRVEESGWTKGRLNCPGCQSRLGGFDFVGGARCPCSGELPSIHVTRSKVDLK